MDINVSLRVERADSVQIESFETPPTVSANHEDTSVADTLSHAYELLDKQSTDSNSDFATTSVLTDPWKQTSAREMDPHHGGFSTSATSPGDDDDDEEEDDIEDGDEGAEYDLPSGNMSNIQSRIDASSSSLMTSNMDHHGFDDIQFFPNHHRGLRLQPQYQFHQDQLNDPSFQLASNLSCFDASGLVNLSGSGSVSNSYSLISDSAGGDINSAFSESPFVFPDNVMEYGEPQFFPGNCVGYLETILEEDDEEYEEEEGCSGRHWWTADSDTDTDSVIRVDNNGQTGQQQKSTNCQPIQGNSIQPQGNTTTTSTPGEKRDEGKPHFRSSASSKPFELEDLHLFDQLDYAFEETLREPKRRIGFAYGHQSQSVEQPVESNKGKPPQLSNQSSSQNSTTTSSLPSSQQEPVKNGAHCQKTGLASDKTSAGHHVFIESNEENEGTTKGLKTLTQENVKAHSQENNSAKLIYEVGEDKEQSNGKKLGNAESRETFGSSLSPSSSDSEAPAEVAEEDFFYSSPGSEEEECRSQEETESEESCSSDDSGKKGVVLAEFSLGSAGCNNGGGNSGFNNSSSGVSGMFGSSRNRRSFESPSRLKSFRSFDSLNCLAGTELLFSKPDTFPSIHHIKEVSEPGSESESSNEVSAADDRGLMIPEEDEEEEEEESKGGGGMLMAHHREGTQSLPSQHTVGFPGPSLNQQVSNKNSASSSTSTVSSSASGSGLRSTENLSEDSGIGNDGISSTAASTPGAFIEDSNGMVMSKQHGDCHKTPCAATAASLEKDISLLAADGSSAKDYISRAEFALNPFVYSSLSSSEPESSMSLSSAPSLGPNQSIAMQRSEDPTTRLRNANNEHPIASSHDKSHASLLDSKCTQADQQEQQQALMRNHLEQATNGIGNTCTEEHLRIEHVSCNVGTSLTPPPPPPSSSTSATCTTFVSKHADRVSGMESVCENGAPAPNFSCPAKDGTLPLESMSCRGSHPQLIPPQTISLQSTSTLPNKAEDYGHLTLSDSTNLDGGQDKDEFANHNNHSSCKTRTHHQYHDADTAVLLPAASLHTHHNPSPHANQPILSQNSDAELTNSSTAVVNSGNRNMTQSPSVANDYNGGPIKQTREPDTTGAASRDNEQMQENHVVMDGNLSDEKTRLTKPNHHHRDNSMSSVTSQPPESHSIVSSTSYSGDVGGKRTMNVSCISSTSQIPEFQSSTTSHGLVRRMPNDENAEVEKDSSFLMFATSPPSFPASNDYLYENAENSSSSDEASQHHTVPQSRVHRQRSDSESEYEAAESAVEENNVDMAYDIIVNSPNKKGSSSSSSSPSSSISSTSGVGATSITTPPSAASSSSPSFPTQHSSPMASEGKTSSTTGAPTSVAATQAAQCHPQSEAEMNANKSDDCNRKSGPVSTLSSPITTIHLNDTHTCASQQGDDNMRNDKRLPVFESCLDDYDDGIDTGAPVATTLPITRASRATSNEQSNNNTQGTMIIGGSIHEDSSCAPKSCHEDGHRTAENKHSSKEQTSSSSSSPSFHVEQAQGSHVQENTSLLHHHHRLQNAPRHNQAEYENSDELTPQSHSYSNAIRGGVVGKQRNKTKNSSRHSCPVDGDAATEPAQANVQKRRAVTLDDSTSADVAHNLQLNQQENNNNNNNNSAYSSSPLISTSTLPVGIVLKSNKHKLTSVDASETKGYHNHSSSNLVTAHPYCPNQSGVAEVRKFVAAPECEAFSVEPPSTSSSWTCGVKESRENNKQEGKRDDDAAADTVLSQSVKRPKLKCETGGNTTTPPTSHSSSSSGAHGSTGKERVILGDSNFGFFGCYSHSRGGSSTTSPIRGAYESQEALIDAHAYPVSSNKANVLLPQVNLDLHSICASESGFSPGYGFPCSLPIAERKEHHLHQTGKRVEERQEVPKEKYTTFIPSSTDLLRNSNNSSIKRSDVSPSSFSSFSLSKAELPKTGGVGRRDQTKEYRQQQQNQQQHLHLEDINLYAGIDKFSVPLGAIKAAVVAVAPTIPSYIVGSNYSATAEIKKPCDNGGDLSRLAPNSSTSACIAHSAGGANSGGGEANGDLSTIIFPKGTTVVHATSSSGGGDGGTLPLLKRGENREATQQASSSVPPDILIWKQFSTCMPGGGERKEGAKEGVMEFDSTTPYKSGSTDRYHPVQCIAERDSSEVEMLRSDSPVGGGSSAPSGIPLKTKTYGPRNEVEVVVVSSRTPSPAPGGFASTTTPPTVSSSSISSRKLPSSPLSSTSAGQDRDELTTSSTSHPERESALRERSSIPPPPSSPPSTSATATTKATRSRVHFSPVVSEISWRESYIDQSSECSGSTEDLLAKLESLDVDGDSIAPVGASGKRSKTTALLDNNGGTSASANLRKAGAAAAAAVVSATGHNSGDIMYYGGDDVNSEGSSVVRPLQVYDIQMSTRADSPSALTPARGPPPSGRGPILVEKVEMTSSPLHDHEEDIIVLGESQSSRKLLIVADDGNDNDDDVDNDPEKVTDLVDFRNSRAKTGSGSGGSEQDNGTLGLYEDVEVQIEPATKPHGSTTLSMVPDLLSQCETTAHPHTLTHIDVRIEETIPAALNNKNIVLNIGPPSGKDTQHYDHYHEHVEQQQQNQRMRKSQSPQPQDASMSPEPRQILPKIFAEDNKNDNKRNSSSSSLTSTSKGKKSSKGFLIQGLGSSGKRTADNKDNNVNNGKDVANGNNTTTTNIVPANQPSFANNGEGKETPDVAKENKKASKPGFFERLSKIRLSGGSKNKKQKVHPKADEIDSSGTPAAVTAGTTSIGGGTAISRPLRSANSVNVNTASSNKSGASISSSQNNTNPSGPMQPILKKSTSATASTIPGPPPHHNGSEMGILDSENEPDEAAQAFENILEEIAGLKSIQLRQEKSSSSSIDRSPTASSAQQVRSFAKRKQFYTNASSPSPPVSPDRSYSSDLDSKLSQFKEDTSRTLDAMSHPDLEIIEDAVKQRQKSLSPEPAKHHVESRPLANTLPKPSSSSSPSFIAAASEATQRSEREWYRLLKSAAEKYSYKGPKEEQHHHLIHRENALSHKTGIVETDLDTGASREMLDEDMLQLDCKVPCYTVSTSEIPTSSAAASTSVSIATSAGSPGTAAKTRSLTNLSTRLPLSIAPSQFEESTGDLSDSEERAKSLEFLLDENHKSSSVPPENKLRLDTRQLSEHELRIQRSLQRLNVPEWYRQHETVSKVTHSTAPPPQSKCGTLSIINKRSDYGSSGGLAGGWTGLSTYKAPSMSSLQSNGGQSSGTLNKSNFVRGRPATMSVTRTSKESLLAPGSGSHSPSAFERSSFTYGMPFTMTRFGHGRLSTHSGSVSPPSTPDSTTKLSTYVKKPYLGWRSQERLNAAAGNGNSTAPKLSIYLPPAERLAADLMAARSKSPHPPVRPPASHRPPLPKAPPRSEKAAVTKASAGDDYSLEIPDAHASSPVMSTQTSSVAVVTKLPQQSNYIPSSEQGKHQSSQNQNAQSMKISSDVHDSIRQVTTAISKYVNRIPEGQTQQKPKPKSGKKQAIWIESSFVGQKPPSKP